MLFLNLLIFINLYMKINFTKIYINIKQNNFIVFYDKNAK